MTKTYGIQRLWYKSVIYSLQICQVELIWIYELQIGFPTWVNPNPKTRVTQSFFKPKNPGLESL